jgi:hypothetical protein
MLYEVVYERASASSKEKQPQQAPAAPEHVTAQSPRHGCGNNAEEHQSRNVRFSMTHP